MGEQFNISLNFLMKDRGVIRKLKKLGKTVDKSVTKSVKRATEVLVVMSKTLTALSVKAVAAGKTLTGFLTFPLMYLIKKTVDAASNAEETANKFKEVFKGVKSASAVVEELANKYKLADSTTQELLSDTGDLLVGLGLARKKALELSKSVIEVSTDVASFKNVTGGTARAAKALTKALLGEREMLKETFKTAVLEAEVKKKALKIRRKDRKLTMQQAKALATLEIVLRRNKDALGDFLRTELFFANQSRILSENIKRMSEIFGRLFLPVVNEVVKIINNILLPISKLSNETKVWMTRIILLAAAWGPTLFIIGKLIKVYQTFALVVGALKVAILGQTLAVGSSTIALGVYKIALLAAAFASKIAAAASFLLAVAMNHIPIVALATAFVVAAALIIANWDKVKKFFIDLGKKIKKVWDFIWPIIKAIMTFGQAGSLEGLAKIGETVLTFKKEGKEEKIETKRTETKEEKIKEDKTKIRKIETKKLISSMEKSINIATKAKSETDINLKVSTEKGSKVLIEKVKKKKGESKVKISTSGFTGRLTPFTGRVGGL
jgi:hypothetical protein